MREALGDHCPPPPHRAGEGSGHLFPCNHTPVLPKPDLKVQDEDAIGLK